MRIKLVNTVEGLRPAFDEDYEAKRKLKLGEIYEVNITLKRNVRFHRKYFALINCSWEYLNETQREFFHENKEVYRKTLQIAAGEAEPIYDMRHNQWAEQARSISFDKMNEDEFEELYERVKDVIFKMFIPHISEWEFMTNLANF